MINHKGYLKKECTRRANARLRASVDHLLNKWPVWMEQIGLREIRRKRGQLYDRKYDNLRTCSH